jgi:hypothetical protein
MSRLVRHTEESLGVRLLERKAGVFVRAREAAPVFDQITQVYDKMAGLSYAVSSLKQGRDTELAFASTPSIAQFLAARAVRHIRRRFPDLYIDRNVLKIGEAVDYLLLERGEFVVIGYRFQHPMVDFVPVGAGGLVAIVLEGHLGDLLRSRGGSERAGRPRPVDPLRGAAHLAALLSLEAPTVDVVDPGGLVESQVLQAPSRAVRFTLNASQSRQTLSGRFMEELFGAGVQHVAFSTSDIFVTVERLRAAGVELLPIPGNYYDDLEARFDLAPDIADRIRALDILYDEDERGAYFQVYTRVFAERFFFEIVERRGGYDGFGAPNAPIRLAAQTRLARGAGMPRR